MRGAAAIWMAFYGPCIAVVAGFAAYRLGVAGWPLLEIAFLAQAVVVSAALVALRISVGIAVLLGGGSAIVCAGLFYAWAVSVQGSLG